MERFNLLDLKYNLTQRWGMAFGRGFPLMSWQEEILKRGEDHSKCHRAIQKIFKYIFPNEKPLSQHEMKNLQDQNQVLGESKQNILCHKRKF